MQDLGASRAYPEIPPDERHGGRHIPELAPRYSGDVRLAGPGQFRGSLLVEATLADGVADRP